MDRYDGWESFVPGQKHRKNPENQRRGYTNRMTGEAFEEQLKVACEYYRNTGAADIKKTPEPFKVTSGKHQNAKGLWVFEGHFESPAQPDFKGTLRGGRSVVFDAKTTQTGKIEQREVTKEQKRDLDSHHKLGAMAFIVVSFNLQACFRVPWPLWETMQERYGHKYMTLKELEEFRVQILGGIPMFLGKVKKDEDSKS